MLLRSEKITIKLSFKHAKPSVKLFYDHYQGHKSIHVHRATASDDVIVGL